MLRKVLGALLAIGLLLPSVSLADSWYLSLIRVDTENAADIDAATLGKTGMLTLESDGSCELTATGIDLLTGTWTSDEENITLSDEDGRTILLTQKAQGIELRTTGLVYVFTQLQETKDQPFTPPNVITADTVEHFYGTWTAKWCISGKLTVAMSDTGDDLGFAIDVQGVQLLRGNRTINCRAGFANGLLTLPDLGVALALDDDGSLSMVQDGLTFFLYPAE